MSELPDIVDDEDNELSIMACSQFRLLLKEFMAQQLHLKALEKKLQ